MCRMKISNYSYMLQLKKMPLSINSVQDRLGSEKAVWSLTSRCQDSTRFRDNVLKPIQGENCTQTEHIICILSIKSIKTTSVSWTSAQKANQLQWCFRPSVQQNLTLNNWHGGVRHLRGRKNKTTNKKPGSLMPQATRRKKSIKKGDIIDSYLGLFFNVFTKNSWRSIPVESVYSWLESKGEGEESKIILWRICFPIIAEHIIYGSILYNH